jgi:hypothetical protein
VKPISVTGDLLPLATGSQDSRFRKDQRKEKDLSVGAKFQKWDKENPSTVYVRSFPGLHTPPSELGKKGNGKLEGFNVHSYQ